MKPFCHVCIAAALHQPNGKCPFCRYQLRVDKLVRCPWLDDVRTMAEKAGESLRKCVVHEDQLMTHFDVENNKPACQTCAEETKNKNICTIDHARSTKEAQIMKERIDSLR